jgi:hypothetical protein
MVQKVGSRIFWQDELESHSCHHFHEENVDSGGLTGSTI